MYVREVLWVDKGKGRTWGGFCPGQLFVGESQWHILAKSRPKSSTQVIGVCWWGGIN